MELADEPIQLVKAGVPELPVLLEPFVHLSKRLCAQRVDPLLRAGFDLDEARGLQDAEVFGDLRLIEPQAIADVVDAARARPQDIDNAQAIRLGECGERIEHGVNMPRREYACQGI